MGRHGGVLTAPSLLSCPVGVAEDVEVTPSVPPQRGVLEGRPRPEVAPSDLKKIVGI